MTDEWMTQADKKGRTPLHLASIWGYQDVVSFIVEEIIEAVDDEDRKKQYLNAKDNKGRTPLFHAVGEERNKVVRVLIGKGADLEAATNDHHVEPGSTPLMACAEKNNMEGFELLLKSGADISATRKDGSDATYIAARYGHLNILEHIADKGKLIEVVERPTFRGRTALMTAALHGHGNVCKFLYQNGATLDHQDDDKFTALICAANKGHTELVKWMVVTGAKVTFRDNTGKTALKYAEANGNEEMVKFLKMGSTSMGNSGNNINAMTVVSAKSVAKKQGKSKNETISKTVPKKESAKKVSR